MVDIQCTTSISVCLIFHPPNSLIISTMKNM